MIETTPDFEVCPAGTLKRLSTLVADSVDLIRKWEARSGAAHPADAMLINKHIRELREAIRESAP